MTEPPLVLYAEDNLLWALAVIDTLELLGCRVEHLSGGTLALAALRCAKERRRHYDLLVLDNDLPSMSGVEVTRHARQMPEWKQTPIILLALEDCTEAALEAGADELLRKPNNLIMLADAVRRLLAAKEGKRQK
jgi:CheY-like chemotaxis protein